MSLNIKKRTLQLYNEKNAKPVIEHDNIKVKHDKVIEKIEKDTTEVAENTILLNIEDPDESIGPKSDESIDDPISDEPIDELINRKVPFFYIDYHEENIKKAKETEYGTLHINKNNGLTKKNIDQITNGELFDLKNTKLILTCWKVLTMSNLNTFSYELSKSSTEKFEAKLENIIKWGSKPYFKERLTKTEQREFTPFREGVMEMLKSLYHRGVKIFIISNSNHSFVESIFKYYKLDKYIESIFTPSKCGLPTGRSIHSTSDFFKDRRKINVERVFVCVERYVGRYLN
jgi:hypothetical protein